MKKIVLAASFVVASSFSSFAQTGGEVEVPPLGEVLSTLSEIEVEAVEGNLAGGSGIAEDIDIAIDQAVADAVAEGIITQEQAADAAASLELVNANAEFFSFNIVDTIAEVVESGEVSIEDVRATLEQFNQLSDAGKAIVGQEDFTPSEDLSSLSAADQAIVNQMPVFDGE